MQSSCAHDAPHYTVQALRAHEKRAVVLPHAFENDAQRDRALHGRCRRDVRYARTIKETQAKPASSVPPEPTTRNLLAGFLAQPRPPGR